jgi:hypothetical protein
MNTPVAEMTAEQSIRWNNTRGDFAYWKVEDEAKWKNQNHGKPEPKRPELRGGIYGFPFQSTVRPNSYSVMDDPYGKWEKALECGKSYMVGDGQDMLTFIKGHRSALTAWQKIAYAWACENPAWKVDVTVDRNEWSIYRRGEYVDFSLPHQDAGGEKTYITRDGRTKILINVD